MEVEGSKGGERGGGVRGGDNPSVFKITSG